MRRHTGLKHDNNWEPVSYASRSMSETERRYAQIEKGALATTWACEKFATYVLGMHFTIETDHKPLVPLLGEKNLDNLPPRILRFRLHLTYSIQHIPGKLMYMADALSRAPTSDSSESKLQDGANALLEVCYPPAWKLDEYRVSQAADPVCSAVMYFCRNGWSHKRDVKADIAPYWKVQGQMTICDGLLLYQRSIVVPKNLQKEALSKIHAGHQGIQRCQLRARSSIWWPGIS